jgi:hypothetical protein
VRACSAGWVAADGFAGRGIGQLVPLSAARIHFCVIRRRTSFDLFTYSIIGMHMHIGVT